MSKSILKINLNKVKTNFLNEIMEYQTEVNKIHNNLITKNVAENNWLGWLDLPTDSFNLEQIKRMQEIYNKWKLMKIDTVVVIGIGGSYLGAKAGYEYFYGNYGQNLNGMELVFAGNSLSAEALVETLKYVQNKNFAINVISKSGTTLEPSIAFREFRKVLENKVGINVSKELIVATTDAKKGVLFDIAKTMKYETLVIPDNVGGRFSVLSPVGLFPLMLAGLNIEEILNGARAANIDANVQDLSQNNAYQYAVARYILASKYNYLIEMFVNYEPKLIYFAEWWKQLFAESEGKNSKGLFTASALFSTDLHSLGQWIQEGNNQILFETVLTFKNSNEDITLQSNNIDLDQLKFLNNKKMSEVNQTAFEGTIDAHFEVGEVPNIWIEIENKNEYTLGYLFQFFERALAMSAYLLGINPFNQPGVEVYKTNMFRKLKDLN
ncbi:glucose-6-phosphate isomerase [Mycoplasmopsis gallinarum]|uniref:glucose-6-phosphate isomerase n=1 Tax=Mycoplasmopsis gallinarum TaxID=29557 RepID=UPI0005609588|nr:glucose-6-phosphate isomerase [Mycoplasmopsis gallinarum]